MDEFTTSQGTPRRYSSRELAEVWSPEVDSHDEIAGVVENRSNSHGSFHVAFEDKGNKSNETVINTPRSTGSETSSDRSGIVPTQMTVGKSNFAWPMSRQSIDKFSVSTVHTGGSDDGVIHGEDLETLPVLQEMGAASVLRALDLPTDRRRPAKLSFAGAECRLHLETPLTQLLTSLGHDHGLDLAAVVLVAWSILLSRLAGEDTLVVGMGYVDEEGLSTQPFPVHVDLTEEPNAVLLLDRVKHALAATGARSSIKDVGFTPIEKNGAPFQVGFYSRKGGLAQPSVDYISIQSDLELHILQDKEDVTLSIYYSTDLYNKDSAERYVGYLKAVLNNMNACGSYPIASFDIISSAEKRLLLETWNETAAEYPADRCIHHLFEDQVINLQDAVAIVQGEVTFTYLELNAIADRFSCQLVDAGVKHGDCIAIVLERSVELVATQLAALKVGAAYMPMDSKAPVDRQAFIVRDSSAVVLITNTKAEIPSELELPLLRFDLAALTNAEMNGTRGDITASSQDTAYVMYTSGSTGHPKGVMVSHRGIARLVINNGYTDIGTDDRVAFTSNPAFDVSTFELWAPLLHGGRVVIVDADVFTTPHLLAETLDRHQVTAMCLTTALFNQYVHSIGASLAKLRYLLCAGERENVDSFSTLLKHGGPKHLIHCYGPTEATTFATTYEVKEIGDGMDRVPIGRPISNTRSYVLDKNLNPVPIGVVGELHIGGPGVANGYLNRPDLTAERFLPDPFSNHKGARMYKTGDLVRYLPDGNIVFLGRSDDQVKIRGFRIELGEIEVRLAEHPCVREAVVLAFSENGSDKRLVAYVVSTLQENLAQTLREHLAAVLPEYMIPSAFVHLDTMPLTNNGKISRRALPAPRDQDFAQQVYEAPIGETEEAIAAIWSQLLGIGQISRRDSFFALGGHSLLVVKMMDRLHRLGLTVPIKTVFESPTLSVLSAAISKHQALTVPPNRISEETIKLTPEMLPLIDLTQADIDRIIDQTPGGLSNIQDIYSLAPLQDGIMFHHLLGAEGDPYLLVSNLAFRDRSLLGDYLSAYQKVVDRHDILRTAFMWEGLSTPAQVVLHQAPLSVTELTLEPADGAILVQLEQRYNSAHYRIGLNQAPLLSFVVAKDEEGRWILVQMLHHMIADHAAIEIINSEVEIILQGQESTLTTPSPFRNQIAKLRAGPTQEEHEVFFKEMLSGIREPSLPFALAEVHNNVNKIQEAHIIVPQNLNERLRAQAKHLGVTLAALCHAAWAQVLARTSGQDRVVFGTVLVGSMQGDQDVESGVGITINTLPFRCDMDERSVQECVYQIHSRLAALIEHENAPLALAQRCSGVPVGSPLFSALLNYRHTLMPTSDSDAIEFTSKEERVNYDGIEFLGGWERTNYPFTLSVEDFDSALGLTALVVETLDPKRVCGYMEKALHSLVIALEDSPDTPVSQLEVLPEEERIALLESWNATDTPYPDQLLVHEIFEQHVKKSPNTIAVEHEELSLTYLELNTRANHLAHRLIDRGVTAGDRVATYFQRSFELVIAQLAIYKIGATYVPIDTKVPVDRQEFILRDSKTCLLVANVQSDIFPAFDGSVFHFESDMLNGIVAPNINVSVSSADVAYIMYTSGSTGIPKGVMVSHRGIARLVINNGYTDIGTDDRVAFTSNPAFDVSTFEIWAPLLHGGRVVIVDADVFTTPHLLAETLDRYQVTAMCLTTALFNQYVHSIGASLAKLRYLLCAGERENVDSFSTLLRHGGPKHLIHCYGPTEATTFATTYEVKEIGDGMDRVPIGRPISNTRSYVLDKNLNPVPIGVVGELHIGGPGVANGYLNRPDLTAERFLPDPFSSHKDARMYKTGDLVRYLSDGNIVFLGRSDDQVKIRGFRIELGEIEVRLAEHPCVREAVVLAYSENGSDKRLVAYVVSTLQENMAETLREHLASVLPEYMVPAVYVRMDKLPVNNIGKIDRRALPEPNSTLFITRDYVAPQGESEVALAELWSDLLKIERVGRHDNFLMLGGHSLLAVQMIGRLHCLGYSLSVRTLFDNPVLSVLAASLSKQEKARHVPPNLIATDTTRITPELLPLIDLSQDDIDRIVDCAPGGVANVQDIYGLSPLQDGILFHHMMASKGDPYLLISCTAFESRDLLDCYLTAFQKVMDRHDILRTAIMWENLTSPAQVVLRRTALSVTELSLDPANGPIIEQVTKLYNSHEYRIKISQAPLIRHSIVQNTDGRWILAQQMHHLVGDHSTLDILEEEIQAFMEGRSESLPAPQPYRNLVAQARLGVIVEEHESFFREMLQDIDTPSLPYGVSENHSEDCDFTESHRMLPQELNNKLREHGKRLGVSVASLCHLAWARVIAATSGQTEVVFGTVIFGRMQGGSRSDRTMGLFINTLPFRVNVDESIVLESVRRVQTDLASLLEHEHASLALVQHCSGVPSGMPLFSALLNYRHNATAFNQSRINPGIEVLLDGDCNNYPFVLSVEDFGSSLGLTTQAAQPYNPSTICGYMQQALQSLTEAIEYAPETPVQTLQILPAEEYDLVVHSWNNTDASYPSNRCIHRLFEEQAKRGPEAIAVMHDDHSMTYRTLNNHANYLVHRLVGFGIKPGDNIAIQLPRSFELIIVQLAILKVGAAYVPIDMEAPVDRQAYIMSDSDAKLLITDESVKIPMEIQTPLLRLVMDQEKLVDMKDMLDSSEQTPASSLDTAYIMYTSGSTGRPKGVMISHRGIANLAFDNGFVDFDSSDRVAFSSNPSFDPSTFEVWAPLLNGASIVIIDRDTFLDPHSLAEALVRRQVTFLHMTNALLHQYAFIIGDTLSNLKYLTGAAEQGSIKAYLNVLQHGGPVRLFNRYGPTETTVDATTYLVTGTINQLDRLPIGRPIKNTRLYVLDKSLNPVPIGVVGELNIGGPGVANGYLSRPDLTAERFLPDPFSCNKGARMYKTGDLVRYLSDGNLVFMGRSDDQVKIRGFRIELGEIEVRLAEHPCVREVVVLASSENGSDKQLVAYVVSTFQGNLAETLREHLASVLPEYMIPSAFVHLDTMPLTSNGKIDRRALLVPDRTSFVSQKYVAPKGDTEVALAELWSELLKIERVGRHDNFFMLGGHSLLAMRMVGTIRSRLQVEFKLQAFFTSPTIAELAQKLLYSANSEDNEYDVLLPLKTKGNLPPLFCIHPGLGLSWQYVDFAKHLHPEQPLYGLQARGLDGKTPLAASVEEMTLDYLDHIRKVQPHGPYHLLGWSFGGTVAHNIAVELEKQGENVPLLVIMDSTVDQSSLDSDDKLSEHDAVKMLFARLRGKDSAGDGLPLWKRTSPIAFNNTTMAKRFTPLVFSGDILIFRATVPQNENAPLIDPTSWLPYTLGEIQVHDVECSHVEMDNPESIALIGSVVAARIEELKR